MHTATDEEIESVVVGSNSYDIHHTWVSMEKSRNNRHWLPWRANLNIGETDDDCEDPDRGVLSDDVISSLFRLTNEKNRFLLSCHFLHFLGEMETFRSYYKVNIIVLRLDESVGSFGCNYFRLFFVDFLSVWPSVHILILTW